MKRVLCFIGNLRGGGAQRQMFELIKILHAEGYAITLLTYSRDSQFRLPKGVVWKTVNYPSRILKILSLYKFLWSNEYDVVISFMQYYSVQILPFYWVNHRSRPLIICGERNITLKPDWFEPLLFWFYQNVVDYIVPNTYYQKEYISRVRPALKEKIRVIYNCVDTGYFFSKQKKCLGFPKEIIITARYAPQKNPYMLLEVIKKLKTNHVKNIHFSWHGDLDNKADSVEKVIRNMRQIISEYSLEELISLKGYSEDPCRLYREADCFCLPSLHEGVSNSMLEAMSCELPCIVSSVADNPLIVRDGENGFLFNPKDIEGFYDAVMRYLNLSEEEKILMGRNAGQVVKRKFSKVAFGEAYIKLIKDDEETGGKIS
ncbi:glycosyltransferase family 4 protein [Parabacteroides sp.]|uniref:glycosyltransferase family 4 protein n=1 Tax=Parabacteroides sp. TaxID=1869337 RepID=UPI00257C197E|nr:glycosyltransferase family 4 protein [Parabacteroides sp.]